LEVLRALANPDTQLEPTATEITTPLGTLRLVAAVGWLCMAQFIDQDSGLGAALDRIRLRLGWRFGGAYQRGQGDQAILDAAAQQFAEYFAQARTEFELPVWMPGRSFDEQVWQELLRIPPGQTRTYGQIAAAIGRPRAAGSVARAVGENRLAIIVPCHRAAASGGRLTNRGIGLWRKRRLLALERAGAPPAGRRADCAQETLR
jgi:AraC family transcriptional regulator of adaptative response/methylated-DNA-[protein]-cysteine methyltransferase